MGNDSIRIDPSALQLLLKSLANVQQVDGPIKDDCIWTFADVRINPDVTEAANSREAALMRRPELLHAIDNLKQLEAVKNALQDLATSCDRKLIAGKKALRPRAFQYGIQALPDEVLCTIFKHVETEAEANLYPGVEFISPLILTHVCSRFRALTLSLPYLWSRISSESALGYVKSCLERSGTVGLTICVEIRNIDQPKEEDFKEFFRLTLGSVKRWRSLIFSFGKELWWEAYPAARNLLSDVDFEGLEYFGVLDYMKYWEETPEDVDFLRGWSMPRVQYLGLEGILPSSQSSFFSSSRIRMLDFSSSGYKSGSDMIRLADFLESLPYLETLSLDLRQTSEEYDLPEIRDTVLPKLKHLTFKFAHHRVLTSIAKKLRIPAMQTLEFITGRHKETGLSTILLAIPQETFASVKRMRFDCRDMKTDFYTIDVNGHCNMRDSSFELGILLGKFPRLECLDMDAPDSDCYASRIYFRNLPPIRTLSLRLRSIRRDSFIINLVEALKISERWDGFEHFKVISNNLESVTADLEMMGRSGKQVYCSSC